MARIAWLNQQKQNAIAWAKEVMHDEKTVFLDTETTGLQDGEICQIAIINLRGDVLLNTLVKTMRGIPAAATEIHGITNEDVARADNWEAVEPMVRGAIIGKRVVVYNAVYDRKMLHQSAEKAGMPKTEWKVISNWECAMEEFARFFGDWNEYRQSFTWKSLTTAYSVMTDKYHPAHSALEDALAARQVVIEMYSSRK